MAAGNGALVAKKRLCSQSSDVGDGAVQVTTSSAASEGSATSSPSLSAHASSVILSDHLTPAENCLHSNEFCWSSKFALCICIFV